MITVDPQLTSLSEALRFSGAFWQERLTTQKPFARQAASVCGWAEEAASISQAGDWLLGGKTDTVLRMLAVLPADIVGPDFWPSTAYGTTGFGAPVIRDFERDRPYLLEDGTVVVLAAGCGAIPESFVPSQQTVWFVPLPQGLHPVSLIAAGRTLVEGAGFMVSGSWLMLYENPIELWPDGAIPALSRFRQRNPRCGALAADDLRSDGRALATYRRHSQSLRKFEAAAAEAAGIPVLSEDGIVARIEKGNRGYIHWLDDGRVFVLPSTPYSVGSTVPAGSAHVMQLLHSSLQGTEWWRGRRWNALGIPLFVFRPEFTGLSFRDEMVTAASYADGDKLRGRLYLNQEPDTENDFWAWQAMQERRCGKETFAKDILGFTAAGQTKTVNALETMVSACGGWFGVLETNLDETDPVAFRKLMDFVARERPAGTQIHVRGAGAYSFPVYINTQQVELEGGATVLIPAWY